MTLLLKELTRAEQRQRQHEEVLHRSNEELVAERSCTQEWRAAWPS